MRKLLFIPLFLIACNSSEETDSTEDSNNDSRELNMESDAKPSSEIRLDSTDWDVNRIFTDTLEFVSFNSDADYWFGIFNTTDGREVTVLSDEEIEADMAGSIYLVEWKIDSCWEAGEGDLLYFDEWMLSKTLLEKRGEFYAWLKAFLPALSDQGDGNLSDYFHGGVGFYTSMNPGAACWASESDGPELKPSIPLDIMIKEGFPEGDMCEGFRGAEDGLYFETLPETKLPEYLMSSGDGSGDDIFKTPNKDPGEFGNGEYVEVLYILEEEQAFQMYFIKPYESWFFWIMDYCDCSA